MLTGQLETGTITVHNVRPPKMKMTLQVMKILVRPFTELTTAGAGIEIDSLGVDYAKCDEIPVTKLIQVGVLDTDEHLVMRVSTITAEVSELETNSYGDTDVNDAPVVQGYVCLERRRRDDLSVHVDTQLLVKNNRRSMTVCCFGLCGITDRLN